jgi:hypothetical protein
MDEDEYLLGVVAYTSTFPSDAFIKLYVPLTLQSEPGSNLSGLVESVLTTEKSSAKTDETDANKKTRVDTFFIYYLFKITSNKTKAVFYISDN